MALMEINVVPIGTKSTSISKYVALSEDAFKAEKKLKREITAMGTIVEASSIGRLLCVARKMHHKAMMAGAKRVLTSIILDERRDKKISMEGEVASVLKKLHA